MQYYFSKALESVIEAKEIILQPIQEKAYPATYYSIRKNGVVIYDVNKLSMEELIAVRKAMVASYIYTKNRLKSLNRWHFYDQQSFEQYFGTVDEGSRVAVVESFQNIQNGILDTLRDPYFADQFYKTESPTYAHVIGSDTEHKVVVNSVFWDRELAGTDSQGGTLIHEYSHFDNVADTSDIVYGVKGARLLAQNDPESALNNADNYEYYAEQAFDNVDPNWDDEIDSNEFLNRNINIPLDAEWNDFDINDKTVTDQISRPKKNKLSIKEQIMKNNTRSDSSFLGIPVENKNKPLTIVEQISANNTVDINENIVSDQISKPKELKLSIKEQIMANNIKSDSSFLGTPLSILEQIKVNNS